MKKTFSVISATQWTLLTTVGLAGGMLTALVVGKPIGKIVGPMLVTAVVTAIVGAVLGSLQSVWLRRMPARPIWWIAATTGGVGIGLASGVVLVEQVGTLLTGQRPNVVHLSTTGRALSFFAVGLVTGAFLGAAQWLVLRVPHWTVVSALGMASAFAAGSLVVDAALGGIGSPAGVITFVVISGVLFGACTSWPLLKKTAASRS
jgi:hypothetical protein